MTGKSRLIIFFIILLLNLVVAVIYFLWNKIRDEEVQNQNDVASFIIMILCPVIGPLFYLLAYVWYKVFLSEPVDLEDVIFSKDRVKTAVRAEEEQERNIVSIEEAIEITNHKDLRQLMMNVVRGDIREYLASLSLALDSEDTETAHYAASVLQDALNDFRVYVDQQKKLAMEDGEHQADYIENLVEYMNPILEQKVFNQMEQSNFVCLMDDISEILFQRFPERLSSTKYETLCKRLLEVREYSKCEKWCERAKLYFPNSLATYTCQLKLYFNAGRKDKFFEVVEALKQSTVVVDSETLELLRVFR